MTLFDLLFIVLFLTTVVSLLAAGALALRGRRAGAVRTLRRIAIGAVVYFGIVIVVSAVSARREYKIGEWQCFDDWCVAVSSSTRNTIGTSAEYAVTLELSSKARRISQRERNLAVYMTDAQDRRFEAAAGGTPTDVLLEPMQSVKIARTFSIPADAKDTGVVVVHEGGFPIGWLIIGYDAWFRKAPVVRLT